MVVCVSRTFSLGLSAGCFQGERPLFSIAVRAVSVAFVAFLIGAGQSTSGAAAASPRVEAQEYFAAFSREASGFARLKHETHVCIANSYRLGWLTMDMYVGAGPGPSMSQVASLSARLENEAAGFQAVAERLADVRAPRAVRADHARLVLALQMASRGLAVSAKSLESTLNDGSVNVGTIKVFDRVALKIPEADKMAARWRAGVARYAIRLGMRTPAVLMTFARVTPAR